MAITETSFIRQKPYVAVALTHFFVDVLNSGRTLLVALLAVSLGLTNTQVGLALILYNVGSALSQPLFGLLADRFGPRWLVVGGMGWMIFFYALAAVAGDWPALVALTFAGVGSGAFHPTGTMVASETSEARRTQATAVFFTFGQLGLFVGPVLAGLLLEAFGRPGYLALPLLALSAVVSGLRWMENGHQHRHSPAAPSATAVTQPLVVPWRTLTALIVIIVTTSTVSIAAINFAPKLFTELGFNPVYVGWMAGVWMLGSAAGGMAGGQVADRLGGRWAITAGVLGSVLPLYFYIPAADPWRFILLMLAGFFAGMPHSVLILQAQALLPGRRALASGLTLGFMFFVGAVGATIVGSIADRVGLAVAMQEMAFLPLLAGAAVLRLPRRT